MAEMLLEAGAVVRVRSTSSRSSRRRRPRVARPGRELRVPVLKILILNQYSYYL